jgi:hypothetical protein
MRSPSLREIQDAFGKGVFAGDPEVLRWVQAPTARFDIYRASVLANLRNALRAVYPVVLRLTGDQFFDHTADRFAREYPSNSGDLHHFGHLFPDFLATYAPARSLAYLADVAHLEWRWHQAFHAANARALDLRALARIPPAAYDHLRFRLQPGCRLLASPYPVLRIWEANRSCNIVVEEVNLEEGPDSLVLYRAGFEVLIARLSSARYAMVESLDAGNALGAAIARAVDIEPGVDPGTALKWLVAEGIVCDFLVA